MDLAGWECNLMARLEADTEFCWPIIIRKLRTYDGMFGALQMKSSGELLRFGIRNSRESDFRPNELIIQSEEIQLDTTAGIETQLVEADLVGGATVLVPGIYWACFHANGILSFIASPASTKQFFSISQNNSLSPTMYSTEEATYDPNGLRAQLDTNSLTERFSLTPCAGVRIAEPENWII